MEAIVNTSNDIKEIFKNICFMKQFLPSLPVEGGHYWKEVVMQGGIEHYALWTCSESRHE
jgi:hypothetical protein